MDIRIVCFNIHKGVGWGFPRKTLDKLRAALHRLHPDIILFQEIRGSQFEFLAGELWSHFSYGKNAVSPRGHYGNAILSKFPIESTHNLDLTLHRLERRGLLHSRVYLNDKKIPLHLLCVHLNLRRRDRHKQFNQMLQYIKSNIPDNEALILGGDFNDWNLDATKPFIHELGLHEAFLSSQGVYAKTFPTWAPALRLDRLYFRGFTVHRAHRLTHVSWRFLSDHLALEVYLKPNHSLQETTHDGQLSGNDLIK